MACRLIRDGILESEAVLSLPVEGRWLFVTILLSADDLGLFEATTFKLARKADIRREMADKLLQMIADGDLVRIYQDSGKTYGFIPRFRQKLQVKRSKHPMPPEALFADDEDMAKKAAAISGGGVVGAFGKEWEQLRQEAFQRDNYKCIRCGSLHNLTAHHLTPKSNGGEHTLENLTTLCQSCNSWARNNEARCNEIKHLVSKTVSGQYLGSIRPAYTQRPEPEPEPELNTKYGEEQSSPPTSDCPQKEILALWAEKLPSARQPREWTPARANILKARWREKKNRQNTEWWGKFFEYVGGSEFLMGQVSTPGRKPFDLSLDWLLKQENFVSTIEGKYHSKESV